MRNLRQHKTTFNQLYNLLQNFTDVLVLVIVLIYILKVWANIHLKLINLKLKVYSYYSHDHPPPHHHHPHYLASSPSQVQAVVSMMQQKNTMNPLLKTSSLPENLRLYCSDVQYNLLKLYKFEAGYEQPHRWNIFTANLISACNRPSVLLQEQNRQMKMPGRHNLSMLSLQPKSQKDHFSNSGYTILFTESNFKLHKLYCSTPYSQKACLFEMLEFITRVLFTLTSTNILAVPCNTITFYPNQTVLENKVFGYPTNNTPALFCSAEGIAQDFWKSFSSSVDQFILQHMSKGYKLFRNNYE